MNVDRLTEGQKILDSDDDLDPIELFEHMLQSLNFTDTEIELYFLLLGQKRTVNGIDEEMGVSERTIRKYLKRLHDDGLLQREVMTEDRLKYRYEAVPPKQAWENIREAVLSLIDDVDERFEDLPDDID